MKSKKLLSIFIVLSMMIGSFSISAYAQYLDMESITTTDKMAFASEMKKKRAEAISNGTSTQKSIEEIEDLMMQYGFATESKKAEIAQLLEKCGVYIYVDDNASVQSDSTISPTSIWYPNCWSGDVELSSPIIYHNVDENSWTVSCSGKWVNNNWCPYLALTTGNLGEEDAFGIAYTNTQTPYRSYVIRSSARITDQYNRYVIGTQNRSDGDGSKGFGFRFNDEVICEEVVLYLGFEWYGSCTYDSNFASYDGVATAYYIHTYSTAKINSIEFGYDGKKAGLNVNLANVTNSFTAFSADTPMNNYGK